MESIDEKGIAKAYRELKKQSEPEEIEEEGLLKELQSSSWLLLVVLLFTLLSPAWAGAKFRWQPPTTQPAGPSQTFTATDVALDLRGARGEEAKWLKAFDVKPGQFTYSAQVVAEDDTVRELRLTYASPFKSAWPRNNVVPAEFYLPAHASGKLPAAIVLDIMDGSAIVAHAMARGLAENGVAALYIPMAYYGARRPPGNAHLQLFAANPASTLDALRQTVMDIRRGKAILAARPEVDARHIGITGVSLGGIMTSLAAGVDGSFDRVVPILAGGDLAALVFHTRETRRIREQLVARGIGREQLETMLAPVEPLHFASRIAPDRCLMINATNDEVIPRNTTDALRKAIGMPTILWSPAGHYSSILYLPAIRQTAMRFLRGERVSRIAL
jgi:dienelactone hydrolase